MGNKLCKKKSADGPENLKKSSSFDRIISRLHLRPNSWKSESQLNHKQVNRSSKDVTDNITKNKILQTRPYSKSSDWTEVDLQVPDDEKHHTVHLRNPKLSLIFNQEDGTPTPPPRKHKLGLREKIEAVAKSGLQAFQSKKPVEEPIVVPKKINYKCPVCDGDEKNGNRNHVHKHNHPDQKRNVDLAFANQQSKDAKDAKNNEEKRKKNLSVVSLPNYTDLKLTVSTFNEGDPPEKDDSNNSLPNDKKTPAKSHQSYMTRARSFGSLIPQQILGKLRPVSIPATNKKPDNIESDDSFGPLEDWDLGIIEHYNPRDASLPRPRNKLLGNNKQRLTDMENLIVKSDDETETKPIAPIRRSESLVKKINKEAIENKVKQLELNHKNGEQHTPPPSPEEDKPAKIKEEKSEEPEVLHSSLMKILEEYSVRDKQKQIDEETFPETDTESLLSDDSSSKNDNKNGKKELKS